MTEGTPVVPFQESPTGVLTPPGGSPGVAGGPLPPDAVPAPADPGAHPAPASAAAARSLPAPARLLPRHMRTDHGLLITCILLINSAILATVMLPVAVSGAQGLEFPDAPWLVVLVAATTCLPLVLGLLAVLGARARGWPLLRPRRPGGARPAPAIAADRSITDSMPYAIAAWILGSLQFIAHLSTLISVAAVLIDAGALRSMPAETTVAANLWVCVQVSLAMALSTGRDRLWRLGVTVLATTAFQLLVPAADPVSRLGLVADSLLLGMLVFAACHYVVEVGRNAQLAHDDTARRSVASAALSAAVAEAGRIEDLIHDNILSCLLLTSRGGADDEWAGPLIRKHAATALATLDEIAAPAPLPELEPLSPEHFARLVLSQVRSLDKHVVTSVRGRRTEPIPAEVAHILLAATLEAVRNSLRHAEGQPATAPDAAPDAGADAGADGEWPDGGAATPAAPHGRGSGRRAGRRPTVRRRVTLHQGDASMAIEVDDNGVGFAPATVPPRAMGLRGSILRRVQRLPGGHAGVASAPGRGTAVHMSWTEDPAARHPNGPDAIVEGHRSPTAERSEYRLRDSRATRIMVGALALMTVVALATLPQFDPWWPSLLALSLLWVLAALLSWRFSTPTGAPPEWLWPHLGLVAPMMLGLTAFTYDGTGIRDVQIWTQTAAALVLVVLALSRYDTAAWIGAGLSSAVLIMWNYLTDQPDAPFGGTWPALIGAVFLCSATARWATSHLDAAEDLERVRQRRIAADVEQAEVLRQRRIRSTELEIVVRPLVARLAGDEPVTEEMVVEAALLEARLRDDMRARSFHGTDVSRAAWQARARGVIIELMDDGGLEGAATTLKHAVVEAVTAEIDAAVDGQVTVRVLPADREVVATVLSRPLTGEPRRAEIYEDGRFETSVG